MKLAYEIWDVFTNQALAGNPLALIPDAQGLTSEQMQAIAKEFNLSETSFVLPSDKADVRARFFTPYKELPMAGHPSIGTLYSCYASGRVQKENATLELAIGVIPMTLELETGSDKKVLNKVWMSQGVPQLLAELEDRKGVAKALGLELADLVDTLPIQVVTSGNIFALVPLDSLEVLAKAKLNLSLWPAAYRETNKVFAFTFDAPESDVRSRMFGEAVGVTEDPATGSAHGPLGWYVAQHEILASIGSAFSFVSHQGVEMARPSEISVKVTPTAAGPSIDVGGQAVKVAEGSLWL